MTLTTYTDRWHTLSPLLGQDTELQLLSESGAVQVLQLQEEILNQVQLEVIQLVLVELDNWDCVVPLEQGGYNV